jgi:hypothetical protein
MLKNKIPTTQNKIQKGWRNESDLGLVNSLLSSASDPSQIQAHFILIQIDHFTWYRIADEGDELSSLGSSGPAAPKWDQSLKLPSVERRFNI